MLKCVAVALVSLSASCTHAHSTGALPSAFISSIAPSFLSESRSRFALQSLDPAPSLRGLRPTPVMRDRSIVTELEPGQTVLVAEDVVTRGQNVKGMVGTVKGVWAKCEEDPICCCAENGMEEASVEVEFHLSDADAKKFRDTIKGNSFSTYFATTELDVVAETRQ